jgi:SAM-dependent methyltransferase
MMFSNYAIWRSHLDVCHDIWSKLLKPSDIAIDATCGKGHDTAILAKLCYQGKVWAFDNQKQAIDKTQNQLTQMGLLANTAVTLHSHETFPPDIAPESVKLIVYNLGYLPGGNKAHTTMSQITLQSVHNAMPLIMQGGAISITLYPGHAEGKREQNTLVQMASDLDPSLWQVGYLQWINRKNAPAIMCIFKNG